VQTGFGKFRSLALDLTLDFNGIETEYQLMNLKKEIKPYYVFCFFFLSYKVEAKLENEYFTVLDEEFLLRLLLAGYKAYNCSMIVKVSDNDYKVLNFLFPQ
jgi:hypothetical protein